MITGYWNLVLAVGCFAFAAMLFVTRAWSNKNRPYKSWIFSLEKGLSVWMFIVLLLLGCGYFFKVFLTGES